MDEKQKVKRVDDESFMISCLKMASNYINTIQNEIKLYASRDGHQNFDVNLDEFFDEIKNQISKKYFFHMKELDILLGRNIEKKPIKIFKLKYRIIKDDPKILSYRSTKDMVCVALKKRCLVSL